ncbi:MAG TPA: acyl carrier protein [Nitrospiraceae bacterium]|nr:acyl carrier protein [Nitrospiraceae bacterium]
MTVKSVIADRILAALAKELKREVSTIGLNHSLRGDLGLNSLDAIELMFRVEEEFDLSIPDADLQKLVTVGDLVTYIEGRLQPSSPQPAPTRSITHLAKTTKAKGRRRHA